MSSTPGNSAQIKHSIPIDILDDLCSRFIINLPPEDRGNLVRICFQIELAHWFYLDYYVTDESNRLNPCGIREFAAHIFQHVPQLREHVSNLDDVLDNWREYKQTVPTYGAILLDTELTHVLLVQSYWTKASWGFPKGKVNEGEEPYKCAAREVLEETGFDISKLMNKNDYIEAMIHDQVVRLYIVPYVPRETKFQPRTRNEIKACEWFALADLPANKKDMTPKTKLGVSPNAFFMVLPFVKRMRRWVSERNPKTFRRTRHKSMGEIESSTGKNKAKISQVLQNEIQEYQNSAQKPQYNKNQGNQHGNYSHGSHGIAQSNQSSSQHHGHASSYQGYHGVVTSQGSYVGSSQSNYSHVGNTQSNYYQGNSQGNYTGNTQVYHNQTSNIQANFNQAGNYSHSGNSQAQYSHAGNTQSSHSFAGNFGNQGHGSSQPSQNQTTQNTYSNPQQVPSASKNPTNRKDRKNTTKRQLFTPQNTHSNNFSPQNLPHNYSYPQNRQSTYSPQNRQNNSPQIRHNSPQVQNRQNTSPQNRQKYSPQVNRRHVSPQNSPAAHFTPVQNTSTPNNDDLSVFYNFIAPSWANFRFDRRAIQECLT